MDKIWSNVLDDHQDDINQVIDLAYLKTAKSYPLQAEVFRALDLCPLEQTKVVFLGMEPYANENSDGLAFSSKGKLTPSLRIMYRELERSTGIKRTKPSLEDWGRQGVMLYNILLTVEHKKPLSHRHQGWEQLAADVMLRLRNTVNPIFVSFGKPAGKFLRDLNIRGPHSKAIYAPHPSPLARRNFEGCDIFNVINKYLAKRGQAPIDWGGASGT